VAYFLEDYALLIDLLWGAASTRENNQLPSSVWPKTILVHIYARDNTFESSL